MDNANMIPINFWFIFVSKPKQDLLSNCSTDLPIVEQLVSIPCGTLIVPHLKHKITKPFYNYFPLFSFFKVNLAIISNIFYLKRIFFKKLILIPHIFLLY